MPSRKQRRQDQGQGRAEAQAAPEDVREEAVEVYLGEKPAEEASEAALEELANPSEVRAPVAGVRPGVTLPETESHPATPGSWDEQQIAEFQQAHRQPKKGE